MKLTIKQFFEKYPMIKKHHFAEVLEIKKAFFSERLTGCRGRKFTPTHLLLMQRSLKALAKELADIELVPPKEKQPR